MNRRRIRWTRACASCGGSGGNRWRIADDVAQLGNQVADEGGVRPQRLTDELAPDAELDVARYEQPSNQALEGLGERRVRNVVLVPLEFPGGEQAARRHQRLVQLVDHGRLSDAGVSGDKHEFRRAGRGDPLQRREQCCDLALAAVRRFRHQQPVRHVVLAEWKVLDAAVRFPLAQAVPQIVLEAGRSLIALLGGLGQQLHDDRGDDGRQPGYPFAWRRSVPGDMAVHPLHRFGGAERKRSGEGPVQRDAERIEVAARVDGAIHAAGLLGCHVSERSGDRLGWLGRLALARQARSDAEAGEANLFAVVLHQDVRRLDLPMDQAALMHLAECRGGADSQTQKSSQFHRCAEKRTRAARRPGLRATAPCARHRGSAHAAAAPTRCRSRLRARIRGRTERESRGSGCASVGNHGEERSGDSSLAPASVHRALAVLDQDRQIAIPDRIRAANVDFNLHFTMPMDLRSTVMATAMTTSAPYAIGS